MKKLKILGIGLSKINLEGLRILFNDTHYQVTVFSLPDANDLLNELLSSEKIDLILTEYQSNMELLSDCIHIAKKTVPNLPFIVIAGSISEDLIVRLIKMGADDFIHVGNLSRLISSLDGIFTNSYFSGNTNKIISSKDGCITALTQTSNDAFVILDNDCKINFWNNAASNMFGYEEKDILNSSVSVILTEKSLTQLQQYCKTNEELNTHSKKNGVLLDIEGIKRNGSIFPVSFSISFTIFQEGKKILCVIRDESRRKTIERELKESRDEFREILENIQDVFYRTDKEGNVIFVNKAAVNVLGFESVSEVLGLNIAKDFYYNPEDRVVFLKELSKKGKVDNYEVEIKDKRGEKLTVLASSHYYHDPEGNILGVEGVFSDITSRKRSEEELEKRIGIEKAVGKISSLFIKTQDFNDAVNELLKYFQKITSVNISALFVILDEFQMLHCTHVFTDHPKARDKGSYFPLKYDFNQYPTIKEYLAEKRPIDSHLEMSEKSHLIDEIKSLKIAEDNPYFMLLPLVTENTIQGFIGLFSQQDFNLNIINNYQTINLLLEILAAAYQKKKSEERASRLATAVEQAEEAIVITDVNGKIQYVNPSFEKVTGYSYKEAIGNDPKILKSGKHDHLFYEELWNTINSGNTWKGRITNKRKDGTLYEEEISISPVRDNKGRTVNYVSVKRDITEMVMLEAQLRQAQKLESIGQLAAGIAHEINTPIQYVGDNLYFLKDTFEVLMDFISEIREVINSPNVDQKHLSQTFSKIFDAIDYEFLKEEIPEAVTHSIDGTRRVSRIVNAMKEFSHPGSIEKSLVDINKAIESTITVSKNEWKYIAELITDFDPGLPPVPCLQADFNQVLLNLIINSAHAIEEKFGKGNKEKGLIKISTMEKEKCVIISVEDSGNGIDTEIIEKIFDPFFTTKEVGKGTGQGLSIAHNVIVDKHNGKIAVESEKGKGTIFTIELPKKISDQW